jgi:putative aldouronate transport system permease protein
MVERLNFSKGNRLRTLFVLGNILFFLLILIIILYPMAKVVTDSLDKNASLTTFRLFPDTLSIDSYIEIVTRNFLYRPFFISIYTTIIGTTLSLAITTLFAYALCQKGMPGRILIINLVLITMVFKAGIIPLFLVVKGLHLTDSLWSVILVHSVDAFYLILMINFFSTIPKDVIDAAKIDGCSNFSMFYRIILPLSKAGLAAIGLFYLVFYWNQFFDYILYINDSKLHNFQVIIRQMVIEAETQTFERAAMSIQSLKNAAIVVSIIPVAIIYPVLQKYFVKGVNLGAVKE